MDPRNAHISQRNSYTYADLFNLDPLMNFQLPSAGDDIMSCTNNSLEGNVAGRGAHMRLIEPLNGGRPWKPADSQFEIPLKRKKSYIEAEGGSRMTKQDEGDNSDDFDTNGASVTEERYRSMLSEHLKRYRRSHLKEAMASRLFVTANRKLEESNRKCHKPDVGKQEVYGTRSPNVFGLLDLGDGIVLEIPAFYDQLAPTLGLPDFEAMEIDERFLSGQPRLDVLVAMVASDPLAKKWKNLADRKFRSLAETIGGPKKFPLQVLEPTQVHQFDGCSGSLQQHGLSGTWRQILSETGVVVQCEVKVIEKGDGYEVIERRLPRKEPDPIIVAKEDFERIAQHWANIVRKDMPKHHKNFVAFCRKQSLDAKKYAECCQREAKCRGLRSLKVMKSAPMRIRKLARDIVIFWKRVDKEQAELRKKEEKEAAETLKREEELREARRQQQRLNFLLTQTELYSHFMQNKTAVLPSQPGGESDVAGISFQVGGPGGDTLMLGDTAAEDAALHGEALRAAQIAASQQRQKTELFDSECIKFRDSGMTDDTPGVPDATADMDLLHPSSMPAISSVQQPTFFQGVLKEYQLKGLQWLVNCYEQGLNGILADEMGLGKTIQAMAFLAHLAEEKNIWGPFLVVAPSSVLNNWADEVNRFCPDFRILPYWGATQERTVLRKNISPKRLYRRDAVFHILITSYQLLVLDEKYLRRVKWQYMVLDEAQAIKSSSSIRWKTLLSFNCRNRLLLTGTPIQNNMAELWALLHFIMPTLFDSHEQFNEWFSKGIENHAEHGGTLNEHQLNRLHSILKPFMLRRVKKDVITEMTNKNEVVIPCILSSRQQTLYQAIKNKISVADLFDSSRGDLNEKRVLNLMNIVIQLRKVCNHPELFERNEGRAYVQFSVLQPPLLPPAFGELEYIHYSGGQNPISYKLPKLLYRDGMRCLPTGSSGSIQGFREKWLFNRLNIFSPANIFSSIFTSTDERSKPYIRSGCFGFTRLINLSPAEVGYIAMASAFERLLLSIYEQDEIECLIDEESDEFDDARLCAVSRLLTCQSRSQLSILRKRFATGFPSAPYESLVTSFEERFLWDIGMLRSTHMFMPAVRAPQIDILCSDRGMTYQREEELQNPWIKRLLVGFARTSDRNGPSVPGMPYHVLHEQDLKICFQQPIMALPYHIFGSSPPLESFDFTRMLTDSGKLQTLDLLLKRLRAENHRVLLFAQMTKMLNILEDYMNYRKYKYLRLDGSSTIMDRRDMVKDFQHRGDIFIFLLSTRAGGLGINLTAADTVIFYESDWNPTMDLQAMDRAHRLGQTKEVTVYRLICKGTIEEKIVKRANQKNTVQQLVMTGGHSQGDIFEAEEVVSLLLDDAELEQKIKEQAWVQPGKMEKRNKGWGVVNQGVKTAVMLDAEGGAFIEGNDNKSSATYEDGDKTMRTILTPGTKRPNKRKSEMEGVPPKPPKVPKLTKGSVGKKEAKNRTQMDDTSVPKGRAKLSKSATLSGGSPISMNGDKSILVNNSSHYGEIAMPFERLQIHSRTSSEFLPEEGFVDALSLPSQSEDYFGQQSLSDEGLRTFSNIGSDEGD